jgi:hypothetical protein
MSVGEKGVVLGVWSEKEVELLEGVGVEEGVLRAWKGRVDILGFVMRTGWLSVDGGFGLDFGLVDMDLGGRVGGVKEVGSEGGGSSLPVCSWASGR